MSVAKLPNGDWDTVQISRGTHDHLAKKQVHIKKAWYPSTAYSEMEPLERPVISSTNLWKRGMGKEGVVLFPPLLLYLLPKSKCPQ